MDMIRKRPEASVAIAFVVGLLIGWFAIGWGAWPVTWTNAGPQHLAQADQEFYLRIVSELYSRDLDASKVQRALGGWDGDVAACRLAEKAADPAEAARLQAIAAVANGQGCTGLDLTSTAPVEEESSGFPGSLGTILALGFLLVLLVIAIVFVINRRNAMMAETGLAGQSYAAMPPDTAPVASDDEVTAIPLARFQTDYTHGRDSYDDSFSIENANGDFLGECGVGISESIGTDSPKNVTAFEVWLFDKNDIRTVTKVVMSDHAFFDEALRAKLAPKGEPILARENETIVLETASLIINAEIKDMRYSTGVLPPQSTFERLTIELSAWAKEGGFGEPDVQGRVDELLNY